MGQPTLGELARSQFENTRGVSLAAAVFRRVPAGVRVAQKNRRPARSSTMIETAQPWPAAHAIAPSAIARATGIARCMAKPCFSPSPVSPPSPGPLPSPGPVASPGPLPSARPVASPGPLSSARPPPEYRPAEPPPPRLSSLRDVEHHVAQHGGLLHKLVRLHHRRQRQPPAHRVLQVSGLHQRLHPSQPRQPILSAQLIDDHE